MSTQSPESQQPQPESDRRNQALSFFLPLLFAATSPNTSTLILNSSTGSVLMISTSHDDQTKEGPPPASESAIKALPTARIVEEGMECTICLEEYEIGTEVKEMTTCKHKFHEGCIEKWLRVNGSCPVCRCRMPDEVEEPHNTKEARVEREGVRREMRIRFVNGEMVIDEANR